jgi:hypothetical protein
MNVERDVLDHLERAGIDCCVSASPATVTGAWALPTYAERRMTRDLGPRPYMDGPMMK